MGKTANRERWRADLHTYRADALASVGLDDSEHRLAADLCRAHADACDELDALRPAYLADPETHKAAFKAKAAEVHELRRKWRQYGEATGSRRTVAVLNDFNEPSDEELAR